MTKSASWSPDGTRLIFRSNRNGIIEFFEKSAAGAHPTLYAATAAEPGSYTGPQWLRETRGPVGPAKLSRFARNDELALQLWELSEQQTGVTWDLAA